MNLQIKCRHADCSEETKAEILAKMARIEPLVTENTFVEIELTHHVKAKPGGDKEAEAILDIPGVNSIIRYASPGETFLEAVDRVLDKLDIHLTKLKDRKKDYSYNGEPPKVQAAERANSEEQL
jgi:ribosomal subunit interface protein